MDGEEVACRGLCWQLAAVLCLLKAVFMIVALLLSVLLLFGNVSLFVKLELNHVCLLFIVTVVVNGWLKRRFFLSNSVQQSSNVNDGCCSASLYILLLLFLIFPFFFLSFCPLLLRDFVSLLMLLLFLLSWTQLFWEEHSVHPYFEHFVQANFSSP